VPVRHAYARAVVTGASSGIGRQLATQLAADGTDLVLVARRTSLLDQLAAQLRAAYRVQAEVLTADLATPDGLDAVAARLGEAGDPVELLVNNAGVGAEGPFADRPAADATGQVSLNVLAVVTLTRAALPGMLARGHGGVLNVSSVAGFFPMPGSAVYAATKAFVTSFSEGLSGEVAGRGVHVTALCPGFTRTEAPPEGNEAGLPRFAWLDAGRVARAGLDAVASGRVICVPGAQYKSVVPLSRLLPRRAIRRAMRTMSER
jgi:short-subunit dehydrogenase